ncbi:MAG: hypothetical protein QMD94_05515, partial [Candidatus Omnitrophota bacterium]|nr:hypothetical protein [Candidatus Omnitrophota bacterium]
ENKSLDIVILGYFATVPLSLLYVHEIILLFKDDTAKDITDKPLLNKIFTQLKAKKLLNHQAIEFMQFIRN